MKKSLKNKELPDDLKELFQSRTYGEAEEELKALRKKNRELGKLIRDKKKSTHKHHD